MTDPQRLEDAERFLSEKEQQLSAARAELERRSQDVQTLIRWIQQLEQDEEALAHWSSRVEAGIATLLNSRRWKLGSALVELGRKVLFISAAPTALDDLHATSQRFRSLQEKLLARRQELRTRREEFSARRGYLNEAKGRPGTISSEEPQTPEPHISPTLHPSTAPDRWRFGSAEHVLHDLQDLLTVSILVAINDDYEGLEGCLKSLVRNTNTPAELLLIDDASTDPRVASLLAGYEDLENIRVLRNDEPLGYVKTVNRGLYNTSGDVVLLDSSVEVTPRWLENLVLAAYADPRTATVTAISDTGRENEPTTGEANETPAGLDKDTAGRLITQQSAQIYPQAPAGSGFCTYVKRAVLDDVGVLDPEIFRGHEGYKDFCMRAIKRGWNHVVDDTTLVFYRGLNDVTLGTEQASLDERHPEYSRLSRAFEVSADMERVSEIVETAHVSANRVRPRILFVLFQAGGGTPYTTQDLMEALDSGYSCYVLVSDTLRLRLFKYEPGNLDLVEEWTLRRKWRITEFSRPDYRAIVFDMLVKYRFELVHIMHLLGHTFDLPEIAGRLNIPVILSFHDFYFSCPTMHLIDDHEKHCGGVCTPGYGECRLPKMLVGEVPALKHRWLHTWRQHVEQMFEHVDSFVTASFAAREVYLRSFPVLYERLFEVIEHGRDLSQERLAVPPEEYPIRILMPGNIEVHKGARFLRELKRVDEAGRLEFHFLGHVVENFRDLGVMHGFYQREEFIDRVREIKPSFVGIFSIWPEIYCHTLTEAWAAGIPVLASDIGTLKERLEAHGGGWLLDHEDARGSHERILEIASDPVTYARELERATLHGIRSIKEMSKDYEDLYESALQDHRSFEKPAS